jgi:hypothetical protein
VDGTRDGSDPILGYSGRRLNSTVELHARVEELEGLKDQMQAVGISIANAVSDGTLILNFDTDDFPSGNVHS